MKERDQAFLRQSWQLSRGGDTTHTHAVHCVTSLFVLRKASAGKASCAIWGLFLDVRPKASEVSISFLVVFNELFST